jgi:lipopolysaccharide biosynthesis glycosyltransferase
MSTAICFVVDPNYFPYAFTQAIEAAKFTREASVHIFVEGTTVPFTIDDSAGIHVHYNKLLPFVSDDLPQCTRWSRIVYGRIFIPRVIEADRIIYLDADIAILSALDKLLKIPFNDKALLAVHDTGIIGPIAPDVRIPISEWLKRKGILHHRYFNSGVLCMNAPLWREMDFLTLLPKYFADFGSYASMWDQDFLNYTFQDQWGELTPAFNYQLSLFGFGFEDVFDPVIVHFTDGIKPWHPHFTWSPEIIMYFQNKLTKAGFASILEPRSQPRGAYKTRWRKYIHDLGLPSRRAKKQSTRWNELLGYYKLFYQERRASGIFMDCVKNPSAFEQLPQTGFFDGRCYKVPLSQTFLAKFEETQGN